MKNLIKGLIVSLSLIAPTMYLLGPVLTQAGIDFNLLDLLGLTLKNSYLVITISNAVVFMSSLRHKNISVSITLGLWVIGMGSMYLLH